MTTASIKSLQIGMHWFPERAGGLDRMYYSLVGALPGAGVAVRGVVAGSARVAAVGGVKRVKKKSTASAPRWKTVNEGASFTKPILTELW